MVGTWLTNGSAVIVAIVAATSISTNSWATCWSNFALRSGLLLLI
jgi:hypothetical protein